MQTIDYPKVKEEIVEMHKNGDSPEKIDETINTMYKFIINDQKVEMLPIINQLIREM